MALGEIVSWKILTIRQILGVRAKKLEATLLFVDFSKAFDSLQRGRMEQILLAYGLHKETITAIMMLYKNTKVKVRTPNGNIDFFDIVVGVLQMQEADDISHKLLWTWTSLIT